MKRQPAYERDIIKPPFFKRFLSIRAFFSIFHPKFIWNSAPGTSASENPIHPIDGPIGKRSGDYPEKCQKNQAIFKWDFQPKFKQCELRVQNEIVENIVFRIILFFLRSGERDSPPNSPFSRNRHELYYNTVKLETVYCR